MTSRAAWTVRSCAFERTEFHQTGLGHHEIESGHHNVDNAAIRAAGRLNDMRYAGCSSLMPAKDILVHLGFDLFGEPGNALGFRVAVAVDRTGLAPEQSEYQLWHLLSKAGGSRKCHGDDEPRKNARPQWRPWLRASPGFTRQHRFEIAIFQSNNRRADRARYRCARAPLHVSEA